MNKTEEISCHNCAYFMQHYVIDKRGRLLSLDCGHCSNFNTRRHTDFEQPCKNWQPREVLVQNQKRCIKGTLENIETLLEKIAIALENVEDF